MRLKRIKLAGFKSFVEPTSILIDGNMTAVLGPNGCGKSNVIDAVRWVLGESSAKNLRGDSMTDVIFNGSSSRQPVSQCSIELIFDNTESRVSQEFAEYNELSIKRIVTRDAQSNYLLNGSSCRRKDITDVFLGTGLGPRSYAIIEQGMISRLIESKPQELRVFIEEAAGISKYKERRRETSLRMRHTHENLDRLSDIRAELDKQLAKLQRQAASAQRFIKLRDKERRLKTELSVMRYLALSQDADVWEEKVREGSAVLEETIAQLRKAERQRETLQLEQESLKQKLHDLKSDLFKIDNQLQQARQAAEYKQERVNQIQQSEQKAEARLKQLRSEESQFTNDILDSRAKIEQLQLDGELYLEQIEQAFETCESEEQTLRSYIEEHRDSDGKYHQHKQRLQGMHSKIQSVMAIQMRTEKRMSELNSELQELQQRQLTTEQRENEEKQLSLSEQKREMGELLSEQSADIKQLQEELQISTVKSDALNASKNELLGSLKALDSINQSNNKVSAETSTEKLWRSLIVEPEFEYAVEVILDKTNDPNLITESEWQIYREKGLNSLPAELSYFRWKFSKDKPSGTLASVISNEWLPKVFSTIRIAETETQAFDMINSLAPNESVVTKDGAWLTKDWAVFGIGEKNNIGIRSQAQFTRLTEKMKVVEIELEASLEKKNQCFGLLQSTQQNYDENYSRAGRIDSELRLCQQQAEMMMQQRETNVEREQKIQQELALQEDLQRQETEELEVLSLQVEESESELIELEDQQQQAQEQYQAQQLAINHARQIHDKLKQVFHSHQLNQQNAENQCNQFEVEKKNNELNQRELNQTLEQLSQERQLLVSEEDNEQQEQSWIKERADIDSQYRHQEQLLEETTSLYHQTQITIKSCQSEIESQRVRLEDMKLKAQALRVQNTTLIEQLNADGQKVIEIAQELPEDCDEQQWQEELESTEQAIKRIGPVNLAAVDEHKLELERKEHLDSQDKDLRESLSILESAIRKIDNETKARFKRTFDQVNQDLKTLFPKVFGGGAAYLELTEQDLLETGVSIMARPPGKKNSTIHLLSGGEKALTALSLVFAIFRLNPAPFCMLDEVDAPLDDVNVERFCRLVAEMSDKVQFVYITHNKIAMEMASQLIGVTMVEPGVSRVVAVDIEQAVSMVEN